MVHCCTHIYTRQKKFKHSLPVVSLMVLKSASDPDPGINFKCFRLSYIPFGLSASCFFNHGFYHQLGVPCVYFICANITYQLSSQVYCSIHCNLDEKKHSCKAFFAAVVPILGILTLQSTIKQFKLHMKIKFSIEFSMHDFIAIPRIYDN